MISFQLKNANYNLKNVELKSIFAQTISTPEKCQRRVNTVNLTVTLRSELTPTLREGTGVPRFSKSHITH